MFIFFVWPKFIFDLFEGQKKTKPSVLISVANKKPIAKILRLTFVFSAGSLKLNPIEKHDF